MGRTKKGQAVHGWLVVDKPAGLTSTAVVNKVKWALDAQKAGHAGTLDPDATGLLAVALGEATKTIPMIADALKCYSFVVRFGAQTTTDDASGTVIASSATRPTDAAIATALQAFRGAIRQTPPQFSAVMVDGTRAYDLAREGTEMDLAARDLWVDRLEMTARPDPDHVALDMVCGKGGYVRAIARDLGLALGGHAHVLWLRRLWSGPFDLSGSVTFATIEAEARTDALLARLLPLETALADLPELPATAEGAARLRNGNPGMVLTSSAQYGDLAWASYQGRAVAMGHYKAGELHPNRVFNR
jgi:tRNA pseudouridine55 synthase